MKGGKVLVRLFFPYSLYGFTDIGPEAAAVSQSLSYTAFISGNKTQDVFLSQEEFCEL
jgi:hypothetical protein